MKDMENPYKYVRDFEEALCEYTGAPYCVCVNSCTNAIFLCLKYVFGNSEGWYVMGNYVPPFVVLPQKTYVGVAQSVINVGARIVWEDKEWKGIYDLAPTTIFDSARMLYRNMFPKVKTNTFVCLSFQWFKALPIGSGGAILTNDKEAVPILKKMRFDGRTEGVHPKDDTFIQGYHMIMRPDDAARGLALMQHARDSYEDTEPYDYSDLSKQEIFK